MCPEDLNKSWLSRNGVGTLLTSCMSAPGRSLSPNVRYLGQADSAEDLPDIPTFLERQLGIKGDILGHLEWHYTPIFRHPNPTW